MFFIISCLFLILINYSQAFIILLRHDGLSVISNTDRKCINFWNKQDFFRYLDLKLVLYDLRERLRDLFLLLSLLSRSLEIFVLIISTITIFIVVWISYASIHLPSIFVISFSRFFFFGLPISRWCLQRSSRTSLQSSMTIYDYFNSDDFLA
jgi:hypothetical protein